MRKGWFRKLIGVAVGLTAFITIAAPAAAQVPPALEDVAAPSARPGEFELKRASDPAATLPESWIRAGKSYTVHNVSKPTLTPFLPPAGKANGTAVVIAPGGAFLMLSMTSEGWDVAEWLASKGITAFVLKYRLAATPADAAGTLAQTFRLIGGSKPEDLGKLLEAGTRMATEDAMEAMKVVRANAAKWSIDPKKVVFMGFSAGAMTTLSLVYKSDASTMPNYVAPVYGPVNTPTETIPASPPLMWLSLAADDTLFGKSDLGLIPAWRAKGGSVEFHMYEKGGHGYGFAGAPGTTTVNWPSQFLAWLQSHGLYTPSP